MSAADDAELIKTADGSYTLLHRGVGECYHSLSGAAQEARALYVEASGLRQRLLDPINALHTLDVGLGLAYNACATIEAWWQAAAPPPLLLVSLEQDAALLPLLQTGQGAWQQGFPPLWLQWCRGLQQLQDGLWAANFVHPQTSQTLQWRVLVGEGQQRLQEWHAQEASAQWHMIWQDPFSPTKNPPLWTCEWFKLLAASSHKGAVLMTYSVARLVRDNLAAAGWGVQKIPSLGRKRCWLQAFNSH